MISRRMLFFVGGALGLSLAPAQAEILIGLAARIGFAKADVYGYEPFAWYVRRGGKYVLLEPGWASE